MEIGDWLFGSDSKMREVDTLSTEQKAAMSSLLPYLTGKVGQGLPSYTGKMTAGMSANEQAAQSILYQYLTSPNSTLTNQGLASYSKTLAGMNPQEVSDEYMKYTAPMERRYLRDVIIPTLKESNVQGGTLRSTSTDRGLQDAVTQFGEGQLGRIGQRITDERSAARNALSLLPTMTNIESGMPKVEAGMQYGGLARELEQADLTARFNEFVRTTPELNPIMDQIIQLMGVQTKGMYEKSGNTGLVNSIIGAVLSRYAGGSSSSNSSIGYLVM